MTTYEVRVELIDGTLCAPFAFRTNKRLAIQLAKICAERNTDDFAENYVVCLTDTGATVKEYAAAHADTE